MVLKCHNGPFLFDSAACWDKVLLFPAASFPKDKIVAPLAVLKQPVLCELNSEAAVQFCCAQKILS